MTTNTPPASGGKRLLLLLGLLCAFPPLSIDMYLPAIPLLQATWKMPLDVVNLTLVGFFATYGLALLVYGPLSDRYGRRRPLLAGIAIYVVACLLCSLAGGVAFLIAARVLQAAGAAAASAIALAITKDVYQGKERERILAYIGVIMAVAPMVAPTIGGWIMALVSWRWVFVVQGLIGLGAFAGVLRLPETLREPTATGVRQIAGTYLHLMANKRFIGLVGLMTLIAMPHFAFIGGSADIYITGFGLSEQSFGLFFALNASALMLGSLACTRLQKNVGTNTMVVMGFVGIAAGGAAMYLPILPGPWRLALPMALASFAFGLSRPPSNNLILEQVDRHAGAASSVMVFSYFMVGALAMWGISLDWEDKIAAIGLVAAAISGSALLVWLLLPRSLFFRHP